ncbi:hypothetical protein [Streptomyces sp. NPDC003247]|uniref:hypothetical protein n=1 Tax=Streptomyces sp. NPDC003247 TaxID=3364677 RepID=UPI003689376A
MRILGTAIGAVLGAALALGVAASPVQADPVNRVLPAGAAPGSWASAADVGPSDGSPLSTAAEPSCC